MNKDFGISIDFFDHPKTRKLISRLGGYQGAVCLVKLWSFTAMSRPDGVLSNMSEEDVEIAAWWEGEPGVFVKTLLEVGFLDRHDDGRLAVHDWDEYNGPSAHASERSRKVRYAVVRRREDCRFR